MSDFPGFDPRMFDNVPLFRELGKVLSWTGGPVNYSIAVDTATSVLSSAEDGGPAALEVVSDRDGEELARAVDVAELWLDQVTSVPRVQGPTQALSGAAWIAQATSATGLGAYVEPLAGGMGGAIAGQLPEEMQAMAGQLGQAMNAFGAMWYGVQLGTVAGHMAGQLLGVYDLGVPTIDPRTVGTVGRNAHRFAADFEFDPAEFTYWLSLREAALRRLWAGVPWLRGHLGRLLARFAAEADLDPSNLLENLGGLGFDPSNPAAMQEALSGPDRIQVEPTAAQKAVLEQLQALVSFVEGWNETVVRAAGGDKLPALPRIMEAMRRRRAAKGPGEEFLQQLLGLDLKPADFRVGAAFCDAVVAARGLEVLDQVWRDESLLPRPAELADPSTWLVRYAAAEIEAQLEADLGPFDEGGAPS